MNPDLHTTLLATTNPHREGPPTPFTNKEVKLSIPAGHPIVPVWESTVLPAIFHVVDDIPPPSSPVTEL